jgi:hypothetical protein
MTFKYFFSKAFEILCVVLLSIITIAGICLTLINPFDTSNLITIGYVSILFTIFSIFCLICLVNEFFGTEYYFVYLPKRRRPVRKYRRRHP